MGEILLESEIYWGNIIYYLIFKMSEAIRTISSVVNTMVGGTVLLLPILFREAGMGLGILILALSGVIAYKTCILYVYHLSQKESTTEESIERISGPKWGKYYKGLSAYILMFLSIIFMSLIEDRIYGITYYFMQLSGHKDQIAPKNAQTLVFDRFSRQYLSLIMVIPLFLMANLKNLSFILKLSAIGSISFVLFLLFIIYQFFDSIGSIELDKVVWFSTDIGNLIGTCAFSFTIHPTVGPLIKNHKKQQNNRMYLIISYFIAMLVYAFIGIFGTFAILNVDCSVTILNCYEGNWRALIVQFSYLLGLLTVTPTFIQIFRTRFAEFYFGQLTPKLFRNINIIFTAVCTFIIFFSPYFPIDLLLNLFGSILGYFMIYLIPSKFHWDCLYGKSHAKEQKKSLLDEQEKQSTTDVKIYSDMAQQIRCSHSVGYADQYPMYGRIALYAILNVIGIAVGIYGIYQFFQQVLS